MLTALPAWGIVLPEGRSSGENMKKLDRRDFFATLGGAAAVAAMTHEARADALERYMMAAAAGPAAAGSAGSAPPGSSASAGAGNKPFPTTAEVEAQIETSPKRRGVGNLFTAPNGNVKRLPPMPAKPTLIDYSSCGSCRRRTIACRARTAR